LEEVRLVAQNYLNNIIKMALLCQAFHVKFIAALQPMAGFKTSTCRKQNVDSREAFYCMVRSTFEGFEKNEWNGLTFISLGEFFENQQELFRDQVHFDGWKTEDIGNQLIAEELLDVIIKKKIL